MARKKNRKSGIKYPDWQSAKEGKESEYYSENGKSFSKSTLRNDSRKNPDEDFYSDDNVLARARDNIPSWYSFFNPNIQRFRENYAFALGNQLSGQSAAIITKLKKSNLVFNKIHEYASRICGIQTQAGCNFRVRAKNMNIDQERVTMRADMLRATYDESNGDTEFGKAFTDAVYGGFGVIEVYSDYEDGDEFEQVICFRAITDPTLTFFDVNAKKRTFSDSEWGGVYWHMKKADFEDEFPDAQIAYDLPLSGGENTQFFDWGNEEIVTVCKYYEVRKKKTKRYVLADGQKVYKEDYDNDESLQFIPIISYRDVTREEWWCYYLTNYEVLKKEKVAGNRFPLVMVPAEIHYIDGRPNMFSSVEFAKDPQILYNYNINEIADSLKLRRREVWLLPTVCIPNSAKNIWKTPEYREGGLPYLPGPKGEKPERLSPEELSQSFFNIWGGLEKDIQSGVGMHDANRGEGSGYESGRAIFGKATLGDLSNAAVFQNLNMAIGKVGEIILHMQPDVYDSEREVGMIDENGRYNVKRINSYEYDEIDASHRFGVKVEAGASLEVQKQAQLETMIKIFELPPEILNKYGDLLVQNLDLENAPQIMKRIQMQLDPRIQALEKGEQPPPEQPNPLFLLKQKELQQKDAENMIKAQKLKLDYEDMLLKHDNTKLKTRAEIHKGWLENQGNTLRILASFMKNGNISKSVNNTRQTAA